MKKTARKIFSALLILPFLAAALLSGFSARRVEAGEEGTLLSAYPQPEVYVEHSGTIPYPEEIGNYYDYDYTIDGNRAYCLEPMRHGPETGFYGSGYLAVSDNMELMKVIYYGYGGPGDLTEKYGNASERHVLTHIACAIAYGDSNPFYGMTEAGRARAEEVYRECQAQAAPPEGACILYLFKADTGSQALGFVVYNPEKKGNLELQKESALPALSEGNSCYGLEGAVYHLYEAGTDTVAAVLTTDSAGYAKAEDIAEGEYEIQEIQAPSGYLPDSGRYPVKIEGDATYTYRCADVPGSNPIRILLVKRDAETGAPQAGAGLENAEFTVQYYDAENLSLQEAEQREAMYTWVFRTDAEGIVYFCEEYRISGDALVTDGEGRAVLPVGTITIRETAAPEGYVQDNTVYIAHTSVQNGMTATENLPNSEETAIKEQRIRGDLEFLKIDGGSGKAMAGIPFSLTSAVTGESHTVFTDQNGYFSTESSHVPHTRNTNAGLSAADGVWFGGGEPDDCLGALPYGNYILEEQPCEGNAGMDLAVAEFTVSQPGTTVDLGRIINTAVGLRTCAADAETGTKTVAPDKEASITDTVSYSNLTAGRQYTLRGKVMVKETGEELLSSGSPVTSEITFTPAESSGTVEMTFHFDASELKGQTLAVFEYLEWKEILLASHENMDDKDQTVYVPQIWTEAADQETGSREGNARTEAVLIDQVKFRGLTPGENYQITGVLMDKQTGKPLLAEGREVTAARSFSPDSEEGTVSMQFTFDASDLGGRTIVVFESVLYEGKEVAVHADIEDEKQSVYYREQPPLPEPGGYKPETPETGDAGSSVPAGVCLAVSGMLAGALFILKRKFCLR